MPSVGTQSTKPGLGKPWGLTLISGVFVVAGIFVIVVVGDVGAGLMGVVFFGGCGLVGLVQLISLYRGGSGEPTGPAGLVAMAAASFALGVGSLVMLLVAVTDPESFDSWRSPLLAAVVGGVGTVFFGGGSGIIAVRAISLVGRR